jgi:hypothetical protein
VALFEWVAFKREVREKVKTLFFGGAAGERDVSHRDRDRTFAAACATRRGRRRPTPLGRESGSVGRAAGAAWSRRSRT